MSSILKEFGIELDVLYDQYREELNLGEDGTISGIMNGLAYLVESDRANYADTIPVDKTVLSLLDGIIEGLRHLALDYYVSFK